MIPLSLKEIAAAVDGQLICALADAKAESVDVEKVQVTSVSSDSRQITAGQLFIALKGPNFDAHRFIEQVASMGAVAAIVDHKVESNLPQIVVESTHSALGQLGAYVKAKVAPKTVGITGSSGKTTVKEMTAAILSQKGKVLATRGNFNNDIGVPLTLLNLEQDDEYAVIELGANHLGEIAYTTSLVKPDVAVINNIAAAHLEGFGDLVGVARAKGEIFEGLGESGVALYNQDTEYAEHWQWRLIDKQVHTFSCLEKAYCYSTNPRLDVNGCPKFTLHTPQGDADIQLPIPGMHNICNAVAAASIALQFGVSVQEIKSGLATMTEVKGRLNIKALSPNLRLIDDSYNANVESTKAAIDLLASYQGHNILILGDMGELGEEARNYHHEVGEHAAQAGVDALFTLGVLSQSTTEAFSAMASSKSATNPVSAVGAKHYSSRTQLMTELVELFKSLEDNLQASGEPKEVTILVKGSRSARMENVVSAIMNWHQQCTDAVEQ